MPLEQAEPSEQTARLRRRDLQGRMVAAPKAAVAAVAVERLLRPQQRQAQAGLVVVAVAEVAVVAAA